MKNRTKAKPVTAYVTVVKAEKSMIRHMVNLMQMGHSPKCHQQGINQQHTFSFCAGPPINGNKPRMDVQRHTDPQCTLLPYWRLHLMYSAYRDYGFQ